MPLIVLWGRIKTRTSSLTLTEAPGSACCQTPPGWTLGAAERAPEQAGQWEQPGGPASIFCVAAASWVWKRGWGVCGYCVCVCLLSCCEREREQRPSPSLLYDRCPPLFLFSPPSSSSSTSSCLFLPSVLFFSLNRPLFSFSLAFLLRRCSPPAPPNES